MKSGTASISMSIRINDHVQIIAGKERGKISYVLQVFPKTGRIAVKGLNLVSRRIRKTPTEPGKVVSQEAPVHYSNVQLYCTSCKRGVRHFRRALSAAENPGRDRIKKVRVCKRCHGQLEAPKQEG